MFLDVVVPVSTLMLVDLRGLSNLACEICETFLKGAEVVLQGLHRSTIDQTETLHSRLMLDENLAAKVNPRPRDQVCSDP